MSSTVKQALLIALGGLALGGVVVMLARRRLISLRYTVGWLGLAALTVFAAALAPLVSPIAEVFNMTGTAVFLAAATVMLIAICIQLSITVSGLWTRLREVAEDLALLEARLEERVGDAPAPPTR